MVCLHTIQCLHWGCPACNIISGIKRTKILHFVDKTTLWAIFLLWWNLQTGNLQIPKSCSPGLGCWGQSHTLCKLPVTDAGWQPLLQSHILAHTGTNLLPAGKEAEEIRDENKSIEEIVCLGMGARRHTGFSTNLWGDLCAQEVIPGTPLKMISPWAPTRQLPHKPIPW